MMHLWEGLTRVVSDSCCVIHRHQGEAQRNSKQRARQAELKTHSSGDCLQASKDVVIYPTQTSP